MSHQAACLLGFWVVVSLLSALPQGHLQCGPDSLVLYHLIMKAHWSQETFPRHFPGRLAGYRPSAQWSRLIGKKREIDFLLPWFPRNNNPTLTMCWVVITQHMCYFFWGGGGPIRRCPIIAFFLSLTGRTHNSSYALYRVGEMASAGCSNNRSLGLLEACNICL